MANVHVSLMPRGTRFGRRAGLLGIGILFAGFNTGNNLYYLVFTILAAAEIVRQRLASGRAADVVHCNDLDTLPIGVRLKRATGRPIVYDAHEVFADMIETDVPKLVVDYVFRLERKLAPQADRIITVSPRLRQTLLAMGIGRPEQMVVIPLGLDLDRFLRLPKGQDDFRAAFGVPDAVSLSGRLQKGKWTGQFFLWREPR